MNKLISENEKINTLMKNNTNSKLILKKISLDRESYKNLRTIAAREYFDSNLKEEEIFSEIINDSINSFFKQYWSTNKPEGIE